MQPRIQSFVGEEILPWLQHVARLRIDVFAEYPYLYDGSVDYEEAYLRTYAACPRSLVVLAFDDAGTPVGASTAIPLADAGAPFDAPFPTAGFPINQVLYLGESVLDRAWRGRGIGHAFFDAREAHARALNLPITAFCAVDRPADHPARPADYRPNDAFWHKRGYARRPDMTIHLAWKQHGQEEETTQPLTFWVRAASDNE